jgi:hypothetical protein
MPNKDKEHSMAKQQKHIKNKEWEDMSRSEKAGGIIGLIVIAVIVLAIFGAIFGGDDNDKFNDQQAQNTVSSSEEDKKSETEVKLAKKYEKIETWTGGARAYEHYLYLLGSKPTKEEVQNIMIELEKQGCGDYTLCDYFLWDDRDEYQRYINDDKKSSLASKLNAAYKEHLAGHMNSGFAFHYYGKSGDGSGNLTIYDADTKEFVNF